MPGKLPPKAQSNNAIDLGEELGAGSHGVRWATIKDSGARGVFKEASTATHYPPELGLWAVANSQLYRLFLGNDAAEVIPVYDGIGQLDGTMSMAFHNAKPMLARGETEADPLLAFYTNPSTETLLRHNFALHLMVRAFLKEDDWHSGQTLFCHDGVDEHNNYINPRFVEIDFDMSMYSETSKIKGVRLLDGIWRPMPEKSMQFTPATVQNIPNYVGAFYWPDRESTFSNKDFACAEAVRALKHATFKDANGIEYNFTLQKFEAILMILLLFQGSTIRERLEQYIPDQGFLNNLDNLIPKLYDEFYFSTVFYRGGADTKEPAFVDFLRRRPSAFLKVIDYAEAMNQQYEQDGTPGLFDMPMVNKKYQQIFRDAFQPKFKDIYLRAYRFYDRLGKQVSTPISPRSEEVASDLDEKPMGRITCAAQMFPTLPLERLEKLGIYCDPKNPLKSAFETCKAVVPLLIKEIKRYYNIETDKLSIEDNIRMVESLTTTRDKLWEVFRIVGLGTEEKNGLKDLLTVIEDVLRDVDIRQHERDRALGKDRPIDSPDKDGYPEVPQLPYNDPYVASDVIQDIFSWANNNRVQLHQVINEAILQYGINKQRSGPIREYLRHSHETGDNQLAYIFSDGGWNPGTALDSPSFNVRLLNGLLRKIRPTYLQPLLQQHPDIIFSDPLYIKKLKDYVLSDVNLFHPRHDTAFKLFETKMFGWANEQWLLKQENKEAPNQKTMFEQLVNTALGDYTRGRTAGASIFSDKATIVDDMLKKGKPYQYILAYILVESGKNEKSLATKLFKQMWPKIIAMDPQLSILTYSVHGEEYLNKVVPRATELKRLCESEDSDKSDVVVEAPTSGASWFPSLFG